MVEASMSGDHRAVRAVSSDGSLEIELSTPLQAGATATLRTSDGLLTGPDYRVAIRPTQTQAALARRVERPSPLLQAGHC